MGGCLKFFVAVFFAVLAVSIWNAGASKAPPAPAPVASSPEPEGPAVEVGKVYRCVDVDRREASGVHFAARRSDVADLREAHRRVLLREGDHPGEMQAQLHKAGRIRLHENGVRVRVAEVADGAARLEIVGGEDRGEGGWVETRYLVPE